MSRSSHSPRQVEQLLQKLEDCSLTGAEHAELMDLLRSDPEMRATYLKHMEFVDLLHAKAESLAELGGVQLERKQPRPSQQFLRSTLVAAAVLALAAFLATYFILPGRPPASVTAGPQTNWNFTSGGIDEENRFLPGTTLDIEGGTVEVQLSSGSELIVEGPAQLTILNPGAVRMPYGRLWARADGDDLTVHTRRLKIVDLGTEFGVTASENLDEEVHVAKGRVRITPLAETLKGQELTSGQAVRANIVGKLRTALYDDRSFQAELPQEVPHLHWSFDEIVGGGYPSKGDGLPSAMLNIYSLKDRNTTLAPSLAAGRFGGALLLDEPGRYAQADFQGVEGNLPRTVALWVKSSPTSNRGTRPLVCWGMPKSGTKWVVTLREDGRKMSTGWGGGWAGSMIERSADLDAAEDWQHVAYVFTGRLDREGRPEIRHYLNGQLMPLRKPAAIQAIDTDCGAKRSWPLTIGTQLFTNMVEPTFTGAIDELYVFRGALGPSQIRALYERNALESGEVSMGEESGEE